MHNLLFLWFFVLFSFHFHMCIYNLYKLQLSHVSTASVSESALRSRRDTHIATGRGERGSSAYSAGPELFCSLWCWFFVILFGTLLRTTATGICVFPLTQIIRSETYTKCKLYKYSLLFFFVFCFLFLQYNFKLSTTRRTLQKPPPARFHFKIYYYFELLLKMVYG